jgi:hypothetical protein
MSRHRWWMASEPRSGHSGAGCVEEQFECDDAGGFVVAEDAGGYRVDFVVAGEDDLADGDVEVGSRSMSVALGLRWEVPGTLSGDGDRGLEDAVVIAEKPDGGRLGLAVGADRF